MGKYFTFIYPELDSSHFDYFRNDLQIPTAICKKLVGNKNGQLLQELDQLVGDALRVGEALYEAIARE